MDFQYQLNAELKTISIDQDGENYLARIDDRVYGLQIRDARLGELILSVNGDRHRIDIAADGTKYFVAVDGEVVEFEKIDVRQERRRKHHHGEDSLAASMPGQVTKVLVNEGEVVGRGQALVVLEAMKMEIKVAAPQAGRVLKIAVKPGQVVDRGQTLIELIED